MSSSRLYESLRVADALREADEVLNRSRISQIESDLLYPLSSSVRSTSSRSPSRYASSSYTTTVDDIDRPYSITRITTTTTPRRKSLSRSIEDELDDLRVSKYVNETNKAVLNLLEDTEADAAIAKADLESTRLKLDQTKIERDSADDALKSALKKVERLTEELDYSQRRIRELEVKAKLAVETEESFRETHSRLLEVKHRNSELEHEVLHERSQHDNISSLLKSRDAEILVLDSRIDDLERRLTHATLHPPEDPALKVEKHRRERAEARVLELEAEVRRLTHTLKEIKNTSGHAVSTSELDRTNLSPILDVGSSGRGSPTSEHSRSIRVNSQTTRTTTSKSSK